MNWLQSFDRALFTSINSHWAWPPADAIFPFLTELNKSPVFWILMLGILVFWIVKQRSRALKWIFVLILGLALSDAIAYRVVKPMISRNRPEFSGMTVTLRVPSSGGNSFPSNHATNMFTAATILSGAFPPVSWLFYIIATLVAYSRVYVGVHFPIDVIGGAMLGFIIGFTLRKAFKRWLN